ncbi:DUF3606 domain-containing protein [Variovorax paradoxus]|uniref:DUF3606 domain-containing protein n=1 Tax=Variovorax paradoxus TaxID=34073 RepID=UPI003CC8961E
MISRKQTQRITANTAADAKAWAKELGCTVPELRIALRAVGNSTERVRTYLAALNGRTADAAVSTAFDRPGPSEGHLALSPRGWPGLQSSNS